jgi:Nickel responsive protein SCO4226-like
MAILVLEHTFDSAVTEDILNDNAKRMDRCLEAYGARWMRSYLSKDRKRMICEFEAADAEQIRASARAAGVAFDRCWTADVYSRDNPTASY